MQVIMPEISHGNSRRRIIPPLLFGVLFGLLFLFADLGIWWSLTGFATSLIILALFTKGKTGKVDRSTPIVADAANTAARNSAALRAMMVDGIEEPLILIAPDRTVMDANSAAKALFGGKLVGQDVSLHVRHPAILGALADTKDKALQHRVEVTLTGIFERIYAVTLSRVSAPAPASDLGTGGIRPASKAENFYIVLSMHDITQMKKIERMRADFVANASHELRTPLSSLIGFLETLDGPARDDKQAQRRFLGIMHEEALRMVRLIDDLLSLSRIEIDKHVQPRDKVDIPALLSVVVRSLEPLSSGRQMDVMLDLPESVPPVRGDMDQLRQVMQNLLSNALKYGHEGTTVTIKVSLLDRLPGSAAQAGLAIAVIDKGPGISAQHIPRLTERFYRIDTARSRQLGGTGLGLAIVKHIMGRHRGRLDIDSNVGKGTTVTISLPLYENAGSKGPSIQ